MRSLALAAVAVAVLTVALSALFVPVSDAPGQASSVKFTRDDTRTTVSNPYSDMTIEGTRATTDHCCDGGKWKVVWGWEVPEEMTPGEGTAVTLSISVENHEPPDARHYFQMEFFAPDTAQALGVQYPDQRADSKQFNFPISAGYSTADHLEIAINIGSARITYFYKKVATSFCRGRDTAGPAARAAAVNEVRVTKVVPGVFMHKADYPEGLWCPVTQGTGLKQGDEISLDPDGEATLAFADNSTVTLRGFPTQLKIASFFTEGGVVRTEILLKNGEVAAKVHKSEATKSDFRIKTPTGTTSRRGTTFKVFHDPGSNTTLTSVTEGVAIVNPKKAGLKTVEVRAGKEIEVGSRSTTKVVRIGNAGARNGNNRRDALARVRAVIARGDDPCGSTTPRKGAFEIKPAEKGWAVSVKLIGEHRGTSKWRVAGRKVTARNALARQLKKRCA